MFSLGKSLQSGEEKVQGGEGGGGSYQCDKKIRWYIDEEAARVFSVVASDRTSGNAHSLKHLKFHLKARKSFFYSETGQALEQMVQRGCGVSLEVFKTWLKIALDILL